MVAALRPGPSGAFVSDIFREIDEELRRDNLLKLWSRYGRYIIAGAVVVARADRRRHRGLARASADASARRSRPAIRRASGARRQGKDAEAAKLFAALAQDGGGYGMLAAFEQAALLAKTGDRKAGAIAAYDNRSRLVRTSTANSAISRCCSRSCTGCPTADPKAAIERLSPLTAERQSVARRRRSS